MVRRVMMAVLAMVMVVWAGDKGNWTRVAMTVPRCSSTVTVYTNAVNLAEYNAAVQVLMADDTSTAGRSTSDSVKVQWGYQTGCLVVDSAGTPDTLWWPRVVVDTLRADSAATWPAVVNLTWATMVEARANRMRNDTACVKYFAEGSQIKPFMNQLIRGWETGLTGNNVGGALSQRMYFLFQYATPTKEARF